MRDRILALLRSSFGYVWLAALAVYFVTLTGQSMLESYHAKQELQKLKDELAAKENERDRLQALISYYQTDNYKEKELRRALLLKMPNEKVYALPESSVGTRAEAALDTAITPVKPVRTDPYWRQWLEYLTKGKA